MASLATLQAQLETLRTLRASGVREVRFGDRAVTYGSDAELDAAITDLERRIATEGGGTPVLRTRVAASKGLTT